MTKQGEFYMSDINDTFYNMTIALYIGWQNKTPEGLIECANITRNTLKMGNMIIDDESFSTVLKRLQENLSVQMLGEDACILNNYEYEPWVSNIRASITWKFWERYKQYLRIDKSWTDTIINALDRSTDKILDQLGNPQTQNIPFLRKGLVIGDVQSGKTATYTALCNKAADAGYKAIIVLTGTQEDLRKQTQQRLDNEFAGRDSFDSLNTPSKRGRKAKLGVAKYNKNVNIIQLTSTSGDFKASIASNVQFNIRSINQPVLFVIKKQKNVLENLKIWLENSKDEKTQKIMQPLLLIDDEADNASINTKDSENPTTINKGIRELMDLFFQTSYVGVTATPFANIFIQPELDDDNNQSDRQAIEKLAKADLFPSDFIYVLDTPSNYIGATKVFGDDNAASALVEINTDDMEHHLPYKHKKDFSLNELPSDVKTAIKYFFLVNAIRDCRNDKKTHRTMMIHISRYVNIQKQIFDLVDNYVKTLKSEIQNYASLDEKKISNNEILSDLKNIYCDSLENISKLDWTTLRKKYLHKAVDPIELRLQNSSKSNSQSLDYGNYKDGLRVIAIGGNSFSRGLTLEGLCVTVFYRRTLMYDTLMQMGRWFGYRNRYDDLCRIWLSEETIGWYRYITMATEDLKDQIREMQRQNRTPKEFGLKVRRHPASLLITARNKMKTSTTVKRAITISGRYIESPRLPNDINKLNKNFQIVEEFLRQLNTPYEKNDIKHPPLFWRNVSSASVANLVLNFMSSNWHLDFNNRALNDYILRKLSANNWDVMIANGDGEKISLFPDKPIFDIHPTVRSIKITDGNLLIGGSKIRIGSISITENGLSKEEIDGVVKAKNKRTPSSADYLKLKNGRKPLLVIFFIAPKLQDNDISNLPNIICALGLGFPGTDEKEECAIYEINIVGLRNEFNDLLDESEE